MQRRTEVSYGANCCYNRWNKNRKKLEILVVLSTKQCFLVFLFLFFFFFFLLLLFSYSWSFGILLWEMATMGKIKKKCFFLFRYIVFLPNLVITFLC